MAKDLNQIADNRHPEIYNVASVTLEVQARPDLAVSQDDIHVSRFRTARSAGCL